MHRFVPVLAVLIAVPVLSGANEDRSASGGARASLPSGQLSLVHVVVGDENHRDGVRAAGVTAISVQPGYVLVAADAAGVQALAAAGLTTRILDSDMKGATYYLAFPRPGAMIPDWPAHGRMLWEDGSTYLLRMEPDAAERLAGLVLGLQALTTDPKPLGPFRPDPRLSADVDPDPRVEAMIGQVTSAGVYDLTGGLSGEWPVEIGGSLYTIATRHTTSGTPIQKATQYVGERLAAAGLDVEYHQWGGETYPNVIGEYTGLTDPEDVVILCAHLDDMPSGPLAPGADDNASGSVAVLLAAEILSQYRWSCTLRFALWTGEEQGLHGSAAYAQRASNRGEAIRGVLNLDMIAWNTPASSPTIDLHARQTIPATMTLAQLFANTISAYGLGLIPEIVPNGSSASDHASFWTYGYPAILGIEDFSDFNPYYHTVNDRLQYLDMGYYTDFVKASLAAFVHLSGCLMEDGPALRLAESAWEDTCPSGGPGNQDGIIDPGETVDLALTIRNNGNQAATGVVVTVSTTSPAATVMVGSAAYPDLDPGAAGVNSTPLTIAIDPDAACGTRVDLLVTMTADGQSWNGQLALTVGDVEPLATLVVTEGFEGTFPPTGWSTFKTGDQASPGFRRGQSGSSGSHGAPRSGTYFAWHDDDNLTNRARDWLVLPQVQVPAAGATLRFWERDYYGSYRDYHGIWVTTGASPDPAASTYTEVVALAAPGTTWKQTAVDLSPYAGQAVWVAFRYEGDFADEWYLDDVEVWEAGCSANPCPGGPLQYPLSVVRAGTGGGVVTSDPAGIQCGAACWATFPAETEVALSAEADPGSVFGGWSGGGCHGTGPCTVAMTAARTVTASFCLGALITGDVNGDCAVNAGDVFYLINHLFAGGPAPIGSGDVNGDGAVNAGDVFYLINHLFAGGPPPV